MSQTAAPGTVVIGGGLTGISAAIHLQSPYLLLEQDHTLGGLARTEERDGFFFDRTGHWLHLRDPQTQALVEEVAGNDLVQVRREAKVFSHQRFIPYPFQANVHGLPPEVVYECLLGYVRAVTRKGAAEPRNFEQYILHHFGEGIAKHFMIPYNTKLWGVHPREITSAWCQRFVPIPSLEQVVAGAVGSHREELGYNVSFLYPRQGGIETLVRALIGRLEPGSVRTDTRVEKIDPHKKQVFLAGDPVPYHAIVSTMPLPQLVAALESPPETVVAAADKLRATPVQYLNVALRCQPQERYHWVYVPEPHLPFYRVGIFSEAVASMAPPGCASLYVELAERSGAGQDRKATVENAVRALVDLRVVASPEDVVFAELQEIDCAYVVFDDNYESAVGEIMEYLERQRIYSRGRYGAWIYNSMEDSLMAGRQVAALIDDLPRTGEAD